MKSGTIGTLNAVIGPQYLFAIRHDDHIEGLMPRMARRKGKMSRGMPVLGQDHMHKPAGKTIDDGNHCFPLRHGECAAGAEIVLNIDDEQGVVCAGMDRSLGHFTLRCAMAWSTSSANRTTSSAIRTGWARAGVKLWSPRGNAAKLRLATARI